MRRNDPTLCLPRTVREATAWLAAELRAMGLESPEVDARVLVGAALAMSPLEMLKDPDRAVSERERAVLAAFRDRRVAREPVSRILGSREFYGRTFAITPATLDPRPDTETVVEAALGIVREMGWSGRPLRVLDIGTGSGCLLVTLLAELPNATGLGTDVSPEALTIAARNAVSLGVESRANFATARSLEGIAGAFDLIVSNPPYIPAGAIAGLDCDVRAYDPMTALDGGADGLDIYREIACGLAAVLPAGWALFEVGAGQAGDVSRLLKEALGPRLGQIRVFSDLGGHERCVALRAQNVLMPH